MSVSDELLNDVPMKRKPAIVFSPDSRYFVTYRADRRLLGDLHLMQSVVRDGTFNPKGPSYRYALPGDEHIFEGQVYIGDMETGEVKKVLLDNEPIVLYLLEIGRAHV